MTEEPDYTQGRWYAEEDDDTWQLFFIPKPPEGLKEWQVHPLQIIKAPKHDTDYMEYWPPHECTKFIVERLNAKPVYLFGFDEVARQLNVTARLVRELWERKDLGGYKIGRHVRFSQDDINTFIKHNSVPPK